MNHLRSEAKFTQSDLSKISGISKGSISRIECMEQYPSPPTVERINIVFSVQLERSVDVLENIEEDCKLLSLVSDADEKIHAYVHEVTPLGRNKVNLHITFRYPLATEFSYVGYSMFHSRNWAYKRGDVEWCRHYSDILIEGTEEEDKQIVYVGTKIVSVDLHNVVMLYDAKHYLPMYRLLRRREDIALRLQEIKENVQEYKIEKAELEKEVKVVCTDISLLACST